jgi:hypothetical protein
MRTPAATVQSYGWLMIDDTVPAFSEVIAVKSCLFLDHAGCSPGKLSIQKSPAECDSGAAAGITGVEMGRVVVTKNMRTR